MNAPNEFANQNLMALREAAGEDPLAVFIDPTLSVPSDLSTEWVHAIQDAEKRGVAKWMSLGPLHENFDPERSPGFLYLQSEERAERLLALSMQVAMGEALRLYGEDHRDRCLAGWVLNAQAPQRLKQSLTALTHIRRPDGRPWYLRFWDPRVVWQLPRLLNSTQLEQVQAAVGRWHYLDLDARLSCISVGSTPSMSAEKALAKTDTPLQFDSAAWSRLQRVGLVNQVLKEAVAWQLNRSEATARRVDALIERCQLWGFQTEQDAIVFAACGLTAHPEFDEHPALHTALRRAVDANQSMQSAISPFDEAFWTLVADGQWKASSKPTRDETI